MADVRLIDANAVIAMIKAKARNEVMTLKGVLSIIETAPTCDAVEVVHGMWIDETQTIAYSCLPKTVCKACGWFTYSGGEIFNAENRYCRNCGAKMDLVEDTDAGNTM